MSDTNPIVIDPVCGMTVDDATAIQVDHDGKTVYFCSSHCLEQFQSRVAADQPEDDFQG